MMMWLLCGAVLGTLPLILGALLKRIEGVTTNTFGDTYVPGLFLLFLFFCATTACSMKLNMAFSKLIFADSVLLVLLCGAACVFCQKQLRQAWEDFLVFFKNPKTALPLGILFLLQIGVICYFAPVVQSDITMESVQTLLATDTIGVFDPMTGQAYATGPALEAKLMILPVFYAYMIQLFQLHPAGFLYRMVPAWLLLVSYLSYGVLAEQLFPKESQNHLVKRGIFLILYGTLVLFGDYLFTMPSYRLLHCGFMGESIVVTVMIPFLLGLCLKLKRKSRMPVYMELILTMLGIIPLMNVRKGSAYAVLLGLSAGLGAVVLYILKKRKERERLCRKS